ncbi:OmpW family protein [Shewanella sp. NIFS-20-20]|uniref:OmpW/AlkL family protein n=1 Tax=Shewanella sp. NIFS-20-20 TaxID=2853806 RepID=UPI001C43A68A|nr:OmpW family outer membrane protein [Shewanella sp. NIFS-20-20]MBV7316564.1 outer membrane beta-barrel protein [Shewanella sp. NIFS-20-20]
MKNIIIALTLGWGCISTYSLAADAGAQVIKGGYGYVNYHSNSGELAGPSTPAGVFAEAKNHGVIALAYDYFVTGDISIQLAAGIPPTVKLVALGAGAALGEVGETTALYPAILGLYHLDITPKLDVYAGGGINYTKYVKSKTYASYNAAFGGPSQVDIDDSWGAVAKLGVSYQINPQWLVDFSYSRYWIRADANITTDTAGVGALSRSINLDVDPDVWVLMVGIKF